ncbi:MAG: FAD-binding oxidoreductase [Actinobacteria bacterium]|nr:MAG: FAD-binding oxidoreductase [Actinomycetota bacterium]
MRARPDVVVVGAGIVGLSIAYHLARRGASVTVLERSGIGAGASGVQPGGVRQQWGTRVNCLLARESMRFWADAGELLQMRLDPGFRSCGYLFLAHSGKALLRLQDNVSLQNELGIPSRIVAPLEAAELVPGLDTAGVVGGAWGDQDGYFDRPHSLVEAFGALADVQIAEVVGVGDEGVVRLAQGAELRADAVVVAAGVDTPRLLPELPIRPEARYLFLSDPIRERLLEPLIVSPERSLAAKQLADGRLLASDLGALGDPETKQAVWRANVRSAVEELLPQLVFVALPTLLAGTYDVTPDHQAILGRVRERVWVAAGFSGRGFMLAPAVGRVIAESVLGDREDPVLSVLDAGRFAEGRAVPEPQVV